AVVRCPTVLSQRSRRSCNLLYPIPKWMGESGGREVRQDTSGLGQAANCGEPCSRQGSRAAHELAHVDGSQAAPGEKEEERAQGTASCMVRLASAQVGRKRALRKPLIDPGKRVRKACSYGRRLAVSCRRPGSVLAGRRRMVHGRPYARRVGEPGVS